MCNPYLNYFKQEPVCRFASTERAFGHFTTSIQIELYLSISVYSKIILFGKLSSSTYYLFNYLLSSLATGEEERRKKYLQDKRLQARVNK